MTSSDTELHADILRNQLCASISCSASQLVLVHLHCSALTGVSNIGADELVELVLSSVLQAPQRLTGECLSRGLWSFGVTERLRNEDYDLMAECLARTQLPEFGPEVMYPFDSSRIDQFLP